MYTIKPIPAFNDNYIWCVIFQQDAVVVDPGCTESVNSFLQQQKLTLKTILITHHHWDHTGGVEALKMKWNCDVFGPNNSPFEHIDRKVFNNDKVTLFKQFPFDVITIPGHTLDHIAYYDKKTVFCGDTLFSAGCGRMFEGTPQQMYNSLQKLAALNGERKFYPTHEYTLSNLQFAQHIEPDNQDIVETICKTQALRQANKPSLPTTMEHELKVNPFLRCAQPEVVKQVASQRQLHDLTAVEIFAGLRKWKDNF